MYLATLLLYMNQPPIRTARDREALWKAVVDGSIDMITSDHAPLTSEEKAVSTGNFMVRRKNNNNKKTRPPTATSLTFIHFLQNRMRLLC